MCSTILSFLICIAFEIGLVVSRASPSAFDLVTDGEIAIRQAVRKKFGPTLERTVKLLACPQPPILS